MMQQKPPKISNKRRAKSMNVINIEVSKPVDPMEYLQQSQFLFSRAVYWEQLLDQIEPPSCKEDEILCTKRDLPNQRVVRYDILRTRGQFFDHELKDYYNSLITYYVKKEGIQYKQGLNELGAPFIIFKKAGYPLDKIYQNFSTFIDLLIPNLYSDDEFMSLQCCFLFFNLLLKFHDVKLHSFLLLNNLGPELYTTPWFITLFASKSSFKVVQLFYEFLMILKDRCFIFYFNVAVLIHQRDYIMTLDQAILPQQITGIKITEENQLIEIINIAMKIRQMTPSSFDVYIQQSLMFVKNYAKQPILKEQMVHKLKDLESQDIFKIIPFEMHCNLQQNYQLDCSSILCITNQEKVMDLIKDNSDYYKQLIRSLSPIQQSMCNHCPRQKILIPSQMIHNKGLEKMFKIVNLYQNKTKKHELIVFYFNFIESRSTSNDKNIVVVEVSKMNNLYNQQLITNLIKIATAPYICLVIGANSNKEGLQKYKQFVNLLIDSEFNYITQADGDCEELFLSLRTFQKQEEQEQIAPKILNIQIKDSGIQKLDMVQKQIIVDHTGLILQKKQQMDPILRDLNLRLYDEIKTGVLHFHVECDITIPHKTFYGSCLMYNKDNFMIVKHNKLISYMVDNKNEQLIPQKKFKLYGMFRTNTIISIKQNKSPNSISVNFVNTNQPDCKLQQVFLVLKLLKRPKVQQKVMTMITIEFNDPATTTLFTERIQKCLIQAF